MGIAGRKPRSLAGIRGSTAQPSARPQPEPWGPYRLRPGEGQDSPTHSAAAGLQPPSGNWVGEAGAVHHLGGAEKLGEAFS